MCILVHCLKKLYQKRLIFYIKQVAKGCKLRSDIFASFVKERCSSVSLISFRQFRLVGA